MTAELNELMARIRSALYALNLLEETGASDAALAKQREHCQALRRELNSMCPDGEYDPHDGNIVASIK